MTADTFCQRSLDRKRVLMNATIVSADGSVQALVNELTPSGARVTCDRELAAGTDVIFKRGKAFVAARVAWADECGAGLDFYREQAVPSPIMATAA